MLTLLASVLLTQQNPHAPQVTIPSDWSLSYGTRAGKNLGFIRGPKGEEIRFPAYGNELEAADEVHKRDPKALYINVFLRGRPVEVTLTETGTLTISPGKREPQQRLSDLPINFETDVKTAQQIVAALRIALSRLEFPSPFANPSAQRSADAVAPAVAPSGDPFPGQVTFPAGYRYIAGLPKDPDGGRFESDSGPAVEFHPNRKRQIRVRTGVWVPTKEWTDRFSLLGATFSISEYDGKSLHVHQTSNPFQHVMRNYQEFSAQESTPRAALILMFAQLTYRDGQRPMPVGDPLTKPGL